jgi:hypothetical protein
MFGFIAASFAPIQSRELPVSDLVQHVLARTDALFSGELHYIQKSGFTGQSDKGTVAKCEVVFSGSSWRLREVQDASIMPVVVSPAFKGREPPPTRNGDFVRQIVCTKGKLVTYSQDPQVDNTISHSAVITDAAPMTRSLPSPPTFAGTIWFPSTRQFVRSHVSAGTSTPQELPGIGLVQRLEWIIANPSTESAFHSVNQLTRNGGKLRLFSSTALGYSLPLIEYVGSNGNVAVEFKSADFQKDSADIFIPRQCSMQYYDEKGPGFFVSYEITAVKRLNETIGDDEFTIHLPVGTLVTDRRAGKDVIHFNIKSGGYAPRDIGEIVRLPVSGRIGTNSIAIILGIVLGVVLLIWSLIKRKQKEATTRS